MAASFVPPKRDIVALIEDVEAAGVRFVYFSPRNMRRSKVYGFMLLGNSVRRRSKSTPCMKITLPLAHGGSCGSILCLLENVRNIPTARKNRSP